MSIHSNERKRTFRIVWSWTSEEGQKNVCPNRLDSYRIDLITSLFLGDIHSTLLPIIR
jgi:hypothetical protein